ncbi:hypothetical protein [Streptomyces lasiicapitis]|uniref:hypothetical protein n=1 Tax=Streptomyces lasiicapitis TaxID=1923961 RepID=UPI003663A9DB
MILGITVGPLLFFVFGWVFALNVKGAADRTFRLAARFTPMIGTSVALRVMGWIWIFVGAAFIALDFLD